MFWLSAFFSLLFNFIYVTFLQEVMADGISFIIKLTDSFGINVHIIRYLYAALFDQRISVVLLSQALIWDCVFIIMNIGMFIIALRFFTAPVYSAFARQINACVAPLSLIPVFFCTHYDVMCMSILTGLMNSYVFWYHVDPPEEYQPRYAG